MEWVETTGRTVEEAKDAALDQLGVDEDEVELVVVEEAKSGLFGRVRQEARVRARVRPTTPRAKSDRHDRRRKPGRDAGQDGSAEAKVSPSHAGPGGADDTTLREAEVMDSEPIQTDEGTSFEEQAELARSFVDGLVDAFGYQASTTIHEGEDGSVEITVLGGDFGLLVGPRGNTLQSLQELARTVVQRHAGASPGVRLRVDVSEYRKLRREALERFSAEMATRVLASGQPLALEPMGPADRKAVHDAVGNIPGVATVSEGMEPDRRVVIRPDVAPPPSPAP